MREKNQLVGLDFFIIYIVYFLLNVWTLLYRPWNFYTFLNIKYSVESLLYTKTHLLLLLST